MVSGLRNKLTLKQRKFVDEYIISGNASDAARKAGYSPRTAFRSGQENMQKPAVLAEIKRRMTEIESHKIMDMTEAMQELTAIARGETTDEQLDNMGNKHQLKANSTARLRAIELIGKRYSAWVDRKEVSGDLNIDIGVGDYDED